MATHTDDTTQAGRASIWREKNLKGRFNVDTTSDEVANAFADQIKNSVVVITGISPNGLGAEAARAIWAKEPKLLILASRTPKNIDAFARSLPPSDSSHVKTLQLDLGSQKSVRRAAAELLEMTPVVDALINNAAIMAPREFMKSEDGFEQQFAINHLGHFTFTNLIMPRLLQSTRGASVVNVSSAGARACGVRFDDVNFDNGKEYQRFKGYGQSKTANLLFSIGLTQKYGEKGLRSFGVDPGAVGGTDLGREITMQDMIDMGWVNKDGSKRDDSIPIKSVQQGSASYLVGAFDPSIADKSGGVLAACNVDSSFPEYATDPANATKLWELSEKLVGETFDS